MVKGLGQGLDNNDDCILKVYVLKYLSASLNECGIACNIKENCNVLRFSDGVCQLGTKEVIYKVQTIRFKVLDYSCPNPLA